MIYSVRTPDGKRHVVVNNRDVLELIEQYAGNDMAQCIRERMRDYKEEIDAEKEDMQIEMESLQDDYEDRLYNLSREMGSVESASKRLKEELDKQIPDLASVRSILDEIIEIVY